jgi:putative transposase
MDEPHLMAAFRYVALNPVKANLAASAADWPWSSTKAHLLRKDDGLVAVSPLLQRDDNLAELFNMPPDAEMETALMQGQSIGRPLMRSRALADLERKLGRALRPGKRGRPASQNDDPRQL